MPSVLNNKEQGDRDGGVRSGKYRMTDLSPTPISGLGFEFPKTPRSKLRANPMTCTVSLRIKIIFGLKIS